MTRFTSWAVLAVCTVALLAGFAVPVRGYIDYDTFTRSDAANLGNSEGNGVAWDTGSTGLLRNNSAFYSGGSAQYNLLIQPSPYGSVTIATNVTLKNAVMYISGGDALYDAECTFEIASGVFKFKGVTIGTPVTGRNYVPQISYNFSSRKCSLRLDWGNGSIVDYDNGGAGYNMHSVTPTAFNREYIGFIAGTGLTYFRDFYICGGAKNWSCYPYAAVVACSENWTAYYTNASCNGTAINEFVFFNDTAECGYIPPENLPANNGTVNASYPCCVEDWTAGNINQSCLVNDTFSELLVYTDAAACGHYPPEDLPVDNGTVAAWYPCNYCSENIVPVTFVVGACANNTRTNYSGFDDLNFGACCAVTSLVSDCHVTNGSYANRSVSGDCTPPLPETEVGRLTSLVYWAFLLCVWLACLALVFFVKGEHGGTVGILNVLQLLVGFVVSLGWLGYSYIVGVAVIGVALTVFWGKTMSK